MKKICVLWTLLVSIFCYAEEHSCCCEQVPGYSIYVPCEDSCFEVYQSVLFLRPTSNNLGWGVATDFLPSSTPQWRVETLKPNYHSAYQLQLCYTLPQTGINTELDWTHLRCSDRESRKVTSGEQWISPFSQTSPNGVGELNKARASVRYKYDALNWNGGMLIACGPQVRMRVFAGLSGVHIKEELRSHFKHRGGALPRISLNNTSSYQGVGPRFGIDGEYNFCGKFNLVGTFASGLFFGTSHPAQYRFEGSSQTIEANNQKVGSRSVAHAVPSFEGSIGVSYNDSLGCFEYTVEAGYMGLIYVDPLSGYETNENFLPMELGSLSSSSVKRVQSNFSLDGPYARLNVSF